MRSGLQIPTAFTCAAVAAVLIPAILFMADTLAQSEHLDDPVNYQALELTIEGCKHNLPLYFHACITARSPFDTEQLGKQVYACNKEAWQKFFGCTGLYPKQTLTEQLDNELGCARGD